MKRWHSIPHACRAQTLFVSPKRSELLGQPLLLTGGIGLGATRMGSSTKLSVLLQESLRASLEKDNGAIHKSMSAMF